MKHHWTDDYNIWQEEEPEPLWWLCKNCGQNEYPCCHKCVRQDGKMVSDELIAEQAILDPMLLQLIRYYSQKLNLDRTHQKQGRNGFKLEIKGVSQSKL